MIDSISSHDYTLAYVDACPSELIHNSDNPILSIGICLFPYIKKDRLKKINQFKNVRKINRKLLTQDYIIGAINDNDITCFGQFIWNYKDKALENGKFILSDINLELATENKTRIAGYELEIGICYSLGWYSIALAFFLNKIGQFAKIESKKNVGIFLDLLPGDDISRQRNLEIVEYIINNTVLETFHEEAIKKNDLDILGYGYGMIEASTQQFKNANEFVITDWIVHSFYSFLEYKTKKLDTNSDAFLLSKLARFLIDKNLFTIRHPFSLKNE